MSRMCRLHIQKVVVLLETRESNPTEDDWAKLRRVPKFLRGTIDLILILGADGMKKMQLLVDMSCGFHEDSKSHTGGTFFLVWRALLTKC